MTPEERKEYNRRYYERNRTKLLTKACEKITCEFCGRQVIKINIKQHYKLPICQRTKDHVEEYRKRYEQYYNF